jgi:hypothetical protein
MASSNNVPGTAGARHAPTGAASRQRAPGTVTASQPVSGIVAGRRSAAASRPRRTPAGVERQHRRVGTGVPQQREQVAADAVADRLDHRQRDRRSECRVHRVAAALQRRQPGLRGQRLRGADHRPARTGAPGGGNDCGMRVNRP